MLRVALYILITIAASNAIFAGGPYYPANLISDSLKENANAVLRIGETTLVINSKNSAVLTERTVITILNSRGDDYGIFLSFYDKARRLANISIRIYDANGNLIEKVKNSEIIDHSAISGFSLYEDDRIRYYKPVIKSYPYTVEIGQTIHMNDYIQFPIWQPQLGPDMSIESANYKVVMSNDNELRFLVRNFEYDPMENNNGKIKELTWDIAGIKAFQPEHFQPPMEEITCSVKAAPFEFSFEGHPGNLETWDNFGKWIYQLMDRDDVLPEETQAKIKQLVSDVTDTVEMVRRIYQYVQENTRYVSIQFGIGGFQPFAASVVDNVGYGDCKALTNYTRALLDVAGIRSVYTAVNAGRYKKYVVPDFPSQQFNHVILHIPMENDTIWLECTNQKMPFGYLGEFTDDRWALAITEEGGKLIRTQFYDPKKNRKDCKATISLLDDGSGEAELSMSLTGLIYDDIFGFIHDNPEEQKKWLNEYLYIPNSVITEYQINDDPGLIPSANLNVKLALEKYAVKSGKRLFVPLNTVDDDAVVPPKPGNRKYDICLQHSSITTDTLIFILPENYILEHQPSTVELLNQFGEYSSSVETDEGKVTYIRRLKVNEGRYPASDYNDFYEFYKAVVKADKAKLVLQSGY